MPRKTRPIERELEPFRDASLLIIASEDTHAVEEYFTRFRARRVKFKVLPTDDGCSSPKDVLERLDEFRKEFPEDGDQFWYCGDTDHWIRPGHIKNLTEVLQQCRQKGYRVAISRPCFEFWLLLHFSEPSLPSDVTCADVVSQLRNFAQGYSKKSGCVSSLTSQMVVDATRRAKAIPAVTEQIPSGPASQVCLIVEELMERESIDLS
jgi:hypothetical protein